VPGKVNVLKVPAWAQSKVTYAMAIVSSSSNKAAAAAVHQRDPEQGRPGEDAGGGLPRNPEEEVGLSVRRAILALAYFLTAAIAPRVPRAGPCWRSSSMCRPSG